MAALDGVAEAVARAREACDRLRWHPAMRRRWREVRVEAGVRAVAAGLDADGAPVPVSLVRDVARGAAEPPSGAVGRALLGALRAHAEVERLMPAPGASAPAVPVGQLVARLHAAAVGPDPSAGRPRRGESATDLRGLGEAPSGPDLDRRLAALGVLLGMPLPADVPALVLTALAHGELLLLRPFRSANGVVAREVERHLLVRHAVDPAGAVVAELAWADAPQVHLAAAARFASGCPDDVAAWVVHRARAVTAGAEEGLRVADAVVAGSLSPGVATHEDGAPAGAPSRQRRDREVSGASQHAGDGNARP